jgi:hypothetical protein
MGMNLDVMSVSCRRQLKYIIKVIYQGIPISLPPQPDRAAGGSQPCWFV